MTCDCQDTCECTNDRVEQFKSALHQGTTRNIEEIKLRTNGEINITFKPGYTISRTSVGRLLEVGWVPIDHWRAGDRREKNKFRFAQYEVEQKKVERVVTETKNVISIDNDRT